MQDLWAAHLWAGEGSAVWGRAAARLWEMPGLDDDWIGICSPKKLERQPGVHVRRTKLRRRDICRRQGIPCTAATRTLFDLGSVASERLVESALEDCIRRGLTALPRLRRELASARHGHHGVATLRKLIRARLGPAESELEIDLHHLIRDSDLPPASPQHLISDGDGFPVRVDLAWPPAKVAVEAQSFRWHGDSVGWRRDIARMERLRDLGWEVVQVTWDDVHKRPRETIARIRTRLMPRMI